MRVCIAILMLLVTLGCDATLQRFKDLTASPADRYRQKADAHETAAELPQALMAWRIAAQLDKNDAAAVENIQRLESRIARKAREHYNNGLAFLKAGKPVQARRELLTVLRVAPDHRQALYYLKTRLRLPLRPVYKVQSGDSYIKIATKTYHDPSKAFLVAYFNGLNPRKPLRIGTALILPQLDAKYLLPRSDIEQLLAAANRAYTQKKYMQSLSHAEKIIKEVPGHAQARRLAQAARFEYGMQLKQRGRLQAALTQFNALPRHHKGRSKAIAEIRGLMSQQTLNKKLTEARGFLERKDHSEVIAITESILAIRPDHAEARQLQNEAGYLLGKSLMEQDRAAQAIPWLEKVDASYADTALQLSLARARTKAAAEERYREGVKHFINENLEAAIEEWEKALTLNPDHPKARQDMENAMRLLEKWRELEKSPPPDGSNTQ